MRLTWRLLGLFVLFIAAEIVISHCKPTVEWAEPVDGFWWDPLRWRDSTTGGPRVPTADDEVFIASVSDATFSVYLDPLQTGQAATVQTLTVGSLSADCCVDKSSTGDTSCRTALVLRGATLTVKKDFTVYPFGMLRFTASPLAPANDTSQSSTLVCPSTQIYGWAQGSVNVQGHVTIQPGAQVTVATITPNETLRYTWGNWLIDGNLTINQPSQFLLNANDGPMPQIKSTNLIVPTPARRRSIPAGSCMSVQPPGIMLYVYDTSDLQLPSFFLYDAVVGSTEFFAASTSPWINFGLNEVTDQCRVICTTNDNNNPSTPGSTGPLYTCSATSSHSFALLLGGSGESSSTCTCPAGQTGSSCQNYYCPGSPECSGRGTCRSDTGTPHCDCPDGWTGYACEIPDCPGGDLDCSGNGLCVSDMVGVAPFCRCDANWTGPAGQPNDCSVPVCSNNCTSPDHGVCTAAESGVPHCQCHLGWALGPNLDCALAFATCPGRGSAECSGHGRCNHTTGQCACAAGWRGPDCSHLDCAGSPDCSHHGLCVAETVDPEITNTTVATCRCAPGWTGDDCSLAECAVASVECSDHGKCVDVGLDPPGCVCAPGWTGLDCSVAFATCDQVSSSACVGCSGNATSKSCASCAGDWRGADCATPYCLATSEYHVFPECSGHGACSVSKLDGQPTCECRAGWAPGPHNDCLSPLCAAVTDGDVACSGHGTCSTDLAAPACICDAFFYGPACADFEPPCPGFPVVCTSAEHGTCVNGSCECADGWRGEDCSIVRCPGEKENCNGRGACNATTATPAVCQCDDHWTGPDCSSPVCPNGCSGHGSCDGTTNPPVCACLPFWGGPDCSIDQEQSSSSGDGGDGTTTTYGVVGGVLGGGAMALVLGVVAAYAVFKGVAVHRQYQLNKQANHAINFGLEDNAVL